MVDAVEKNFPTVLTFLEELDECGLASKGTNHKAHVYLYDINVLYLYLFLVSRTEMTTEYQEIELELGKLEVELNEHYPLTGSKPQDGLALPGLDKFSTTMHQFYKEASTEFKRICMISGKMDECYDQVVRFYGEDPKKMQPDEFFGIFKEFTTSWYKCSADSKEVKMKQDRVEKQKKRDQERRKRANSNAGSLKSKVEDEDDKAILHSLLDKLKKDTLDVKVRRRSDRRSRQRSTSVSTALQQSFSTANNPDSIYLKANKMLRNIQGENSSSLLVDGNLASPTLFEFNTGPGTRRRMSAASIVAPGFKPLFFDSDATESPMTATGPSSSSLLHALPEETRRINRRHGPRPLSAIIIPQASLSSQSQSSTHLTTPTTATAPARTVRVRKTSKRPIFDHTLRVRARRMSTR